MNDDSFVVEPGIKDQEMRAAIKITFCILFLFFSCLQEDRVQPLKGNVTFSLVETDRINGRLGKTGDPAFVIISIQDNNGFKMDDIELILFSFGAGYLSEELELPAGTYELTYFVVYDTSGRAIYASPHVGSELAKFVTDSLPMKFTVNEDAQVIPQVLRVLEDDLPEFFGYASVSFEIIDRKEKVKKIVFRDLFIDEEVTTLFFEYKNEEVETVHWDLYFPSADINRSYSEVRFYSVAGKLDSIASSRFNGEPWNLSYEYNGEQLNKIESIRNENISTVTFLDYSDSNPIQIENLYGVYGIYEGLTYPRYTTFNFDANGNLTSQKHTDIQGFPNVVHERTATYSFELNPLRNLIKTPLPQALEHYDDLIFHFSTNLPSSSEANYPFVDPINNRIVFEYDKDDEGRIIRIRALSPPDNARYTLDISYY